jgi:hypothetical protein
MANLNYLSKKLFQYEAYPVLLSCNFVVDPANGNGLGIRSLKGAGVANVYMHTSATAAGGNPNPAAGYIMVQLTQTYNRYLGGFQGAVTTLSGSPATSTTAHTTYVITALGTATLAQWQAKGLPTGVTPALGASFVATASGTIGGSATVDVASTAGSDYSYIEIVGDPNQTIISPVALQPSQVQPIGPSAGGYLNMRCMLDGSVATPATGSVISLSFYLSNSSILTQGQ